MATSDKPSIGRGLAGPSVYYVDNLLDEIGEPMNTHNLLIRAVDILINPTDKSPMFHEDLITELTTSFEENCCDYDNTQSIQSVDNIIKDFLSAVNTFYDGERLSIIIGKRYPALIHKVYKIINDCNLITMTTESDGIKLYNRKTGRAFGY